MNQGRVRGGGRLGSLAIAACTAAWGIGFFAGGTGGLDKAAGSVVPLFRSGRSGGTGGFAGAGCFACCGGVAGVCVVLIGGDVIRGAGGAAAVFDAATTGTGTTRVGLSSSLS